LYLNVSIYLRPLLPPPKFTKTLFVMKYLDFTVILGLSLGAASVASAAEVDTDFYGSSSALGAEIRPSVPLTSLNDHRSSLYVSSSDVQGVDYESKAFSFGEPLPQPSASLIAGDTSSSTSPELYENPFGLEIPASINPYDFSHKKHCDVLRHLKVPATRRRLDSYLRPQYILKSNNVSKTFSTETDQLVATKARKDLYKAGVDIYGCYALDFAADIVSNTSKNPIARGTEGPWQDWQGNSMLVLGVDAYSRLISKNWKGGQWHASFTYPDALNTVPFILMETH